MALAAASTLHSTTRAVRLAKPPQHVRHRLFEKPAALRCHFALCLGVGVLGDPSQGVFEKVGAVSDFILIPGRPGILDLRAISDSVALVNGKSAVMASPGRTVPSIKTAP
jgi:hypothetical protein